MVGIEHGSMMLARMAGLDVAETQLASPLNKKVILVNHRQRVGVLRARVERRKALIRTEICWILADIYTDSKLIWGTQKLHPSMVFFEGRVWGFISNSRVDFVEEKR